jgi:uncharacterized protein YkwD
VERVKVGLNELVWNDDLRTASRNHNKDMRANSYFSHTGFDGSQPWDRVMKITDVFTYSGENILHASGTSIGRETPVRWVNEWLGSIGHLLNMLDSDWTHTGVGLEVRLNSNGEVREMWATQKFGHIEGFRQPSNVPSPTPAPLPAVTVTILIDGEWVEMTIDEYMVWLSESLVITPVPTPAPIVHTDPFHIENLLKEHGKYEALDIFEKEVFRLTNVERVNHGVHELIWDDRLAQAARNHSIDMSINSFLSHAGSDNTSRSTRLQRVGFCRTMGSSENCDGGQVTPTAQVARWMNSPGHRDNLLSVNNIYYGGGFYFIYDINNNIINFRHTQKFSNELILAN